MEQKKKKILLAVLLSAAGLVLLLAAVAGVVWLCNDFTLTLDVPGEPEVTLEYGAPYTPPVGTAEYRGTLLLKAGKPLEVTAEGSVNTSVVGTYVQTYWAEYRGERAEVTRVVHIVDRKPPEITLRSFDGWYTLPGCPYVEEGVTAYDEYDGDLTKQIQRRDTETEVIYTVTDAAGNTAEARRKIFYNDPFPPELVLLGDGEMTIDQNQTYQEPGYTATDNCDGDLTGQVQVEGLVNPSAPGTYILKYQVTDRYGNTASAERKVTVHRAAPPSRPPSRIQTPSEARVRPFT